MAKALTDVMVRFEGSEAFREVVWVLIEELHTDGWHRRQAVRGAEVLDDHAFEIQRHRRDDRR